MARADACVIKTYETQAQAYAWIAEQDELTGGPIIDPKIVAAGEKMTANFVRTLNSILSNEGCTCAAASGVIGHAAFCPLGDGTKPESGAA